MRLVQIDCGGGRVLETSSRAARFAARRFLVAQPLEQRDRLSVGKVFRFRTELRDELIVLAHDIILAPHVVTEQVYFDGLFRVYRSI